jgi:hypothetical protein
LLYFAAVQQDLGKGVLMECASSFLRFAPRSDILQQSSQHAWGGTAMRWWREAVRRRRHETSQSPEKLRYRLTALQRMIPGLGAAIGVLGAQVAGWANGEGPPTGHELWDVIRVAVIVPTALLLLSRTYGVTITPSKVIAHGTTRRTIPLIDIRLIRVENFMGSQTIVIHDVTGRRTRLRAPITGPLHRDREFWVKFHAIGRWWLDHGGAGPVDALPVPPP